MRNLNEMGVPFPFPISILSSHSSSTVLNLSAICAKPFSRSFGEMIC